MSCDTMNGLKYLIFMENDVQNILRDSISFNSKINKKGYTIHVYIYI